MHIPKKGLRACGIAESYAGRRYSTLAGVVMRKDLLIDGITFGRVTVGGTDATDEVIRMVQELERKDINVILLSGCVVAWFRWRYEFGLCCRLIACGESSWLAWRVDAFSWGKS